MLTQSMIAALILGAAAPAPVRMSLPGIDGKAHAVPVAGAKATAVVRPSQPVAMIAIAASRR